MQLTGETEVSAVQRMLVQGNPGLLEAPAGLAVESALWVDTASGPDCRWMKLETVGLTTPWEEPFLPQCSWTLAGYADNT